MARVNVVLADTDEWYAQSLSRYLRTSSSGKFNVFVFTSRQDMIEYLSESPDTGILLVGSDMYGTDIPQPKNSVVVILTGSNGYNLDSSLPCINKYQPGDKIYKSISEIYSRTFSNAASVLSGKKRTCTITVYSPQGGSGKSVLSINMAVYYAKAGHKVFYLGLQSFSTSTLCFGKRSDAESMSNVLFYLKQQTDSLPVKINNAQTFDAELGIGYYEPAECALELDEVSDTDIMRLIETLKDSSKYDLIIIDTDSVFNRKNINILNSSDAVLLPVVQDLCIQPVLDRFAEQLRKIDPLTYETAVERVLPVVNKYNPNSMIRDIQFNGKSITGRIPSVNDLYIEADGGLKINPAGSMTALVGNMASKIAELTGICLQRGNSGGVI